MTVAAPISARLPVPFQDPVQSRAEGDEADQRDADARSISRAVARGDRTALERLYNAWFDRWLAAAKRWTGCDESFCLDIVQDATLRVVRSIREKKTHAQLEGWMMLVLRSAALDRLRSEHRRAKRDTQAPRPLAGTNALHGRESADLDERIAWLERALADLPEPTADLLARRYALDQTLDSIANTNGQTRGTVHGKLRRAVNHLRARALEVFHDR